jgi:single-strand DNA-binding protein
MGSLNICTFIGNLGRDAELKYTAGGQAVTTFSIACTDVWNDKNGQKQERTEWVRCNLWGKSAEAVSEYLTKGKQLYVSGKMQTRQWEDKDGNKRYTTEIRADKVVLLGGGQGRATHHDAADNGAAHGRSRAAEEEPQQQPNEDEIPF